MTKVHFPFRHGAESYLRRFEAEIDCLAEDKLLVRGTLSDDDFTLKHEWTLSTPNYEVLEARAEQTAGGFDPALCRNYDRVRGVRIGRGFSKRILDALGRGEGQQEHLFLAIEMARVGQQVYQFPQDFEREFQLTNRPVAERSAAAKVAWLKDRSYMSDLANSCYTYRDESAALFEARDVRCGFGNDLTRPRPGDERVFWRQKSVSIRNGGDATYQCESIMQDSIHDIRVQFEVAEDGVILAASSLGVRLPYHGLCEDAQLRTGGLVGVRVTRDFVRQFADHVGGSSGCTHLFDLSIDCLRLFQVS